MSYPVFKDFDKSAYDLIDEDFSTKYTLKIKSAGPSNTTITTNTELKDSTLVPKISVKYAAANGFTLEKFETASDTKLTLETSLVGASEGLKFEFKGNTTDKGDISFIYSLPAVTLTGEFDTVKFSSAKASFSGGHGPFTAGASADLKIDKTSVKNLSFGLGFGYTLPKSLFFGLRMTDLKKYSGVFSYAAYKGITLGGLITYTSDEKAKGALPILTLAGLYNCNPSTSVKVKATSEGVLSASVKQSLEKKFSVIAAAELSSTSKPVKLGVNATLG